MLWYKSWLETRWRFLIGLGLSVCSAVSVVLFYPRMMELMALVPNVDVGGELGRKIRESVELAREYRGYVWTQWFGRNQMQMSTLSPRSRCMSNTRRTRPSASSGLSAPSTPNFLGAPVSSNSPAHTKT